jgi:hypothetical protein
MSTTIICNRSRSYGQPRRLTSWKNEARADSPGPAIGVTRYPTYMSRREEWRKVLDSEVQRWSVMSYDQLVFDLRDLQAYQVEFNSKTYQVEVEILEYADDYVHVLVAVDDGSLPASILPSTHTFLCRKSLPTA